MATFIIGFLQVASRNYIIAPIMLFPLVVAAVGIVAASMALLVVGVFCIIIFSTYLLLTLIEVKGAKY